MEKGEIRQNKITKQWVIYAPSRYMRPNEFQQSEKRKGKLPEFDPDCPFCPGNEEKLPSIISQIPGDEDSWKTRTVPNKYPALIPEGDTEQVKRGIYVTMPGYGKHEVIIETPYHNRDIPEMSEEEVRTIIETYHERYLRNIKGHSKMMVIIFRNHGKRAGTSLPHPHSQLIATGIIPEYVRWREREAHNYYEQNRKCIFCDILDFEKSEMKRVIYENDSFLAFVPFFAEVPFEVWIMPRKHTSNFVFIDENEKDELAGAIREILKRICDILNDPDYNYVIHTSSSNSMDKPYLHWYVQILPRLTTRAGFEIGSGMYINPSIPEKDARFLNSKRS